jgi:hypothetical protein
LKLKPAESFSHIVDITKSTWKCLREAGTNVSKRLLIRSGSEVVGHVQMDRIYPSTWCTHALAIDPKVSKTVGKEIYAAVTDVLSAEGARYLFTLTTASLNWNQRNYYDFVKSYRYPEHNELRLLEMHEADTARGWSLPSYSALETRLANKYDLQRIDRYFQLHSSEIERKAMSLTGPEMDLKGLNAELEPFGLSRRREFVVGLLEGRFIGFAMLESGTTGVSIFGLQDTMYVHLLPELETDRHRIQDALIGAALERYKHHGVPTVGILLSDSRREHYSACGLPFIGEEMRWLAACVATRRYHAFSQMLYGNLLLRREMIHSRSKTK